MALLLSALSALNGSFTATNGAGEGYCSDFYGSWKNSLDCTRAIRGLVHGAELVEYSVNQGEGGQRNLPYHVEYGI